MEFDKDTFLNSIKHYDSQKSKLRYVQKLYSNYILIQKILRGSGGDIQLNDLLGKYEDKIYTIDGNLLNDKERIKYELKNIDNIGIKQGNKYAKEIKDLIQKFDNIKDDEDLIFYIKKQISMIQAKLGIRITFYYAAYVAFLDIYKNLYMNEIEQNIGNSNLEYKKNKG